MADANGAIQDVAFDSHLGVTCGVVMPISALGDCNETHWSEVLSIISESVAAVGLTAKLVSNADEVTVIQKTIIQNLYNEPLVICDVSGKNANVMFELGMRLAFDKPTIVIKDDKTSFSFDTGVIEHLEYPRDLRFSQIVEFKKRLGEKAKATLKASQSNPSYSTFLGHFGTFKVAALEQKEVTGQEYIMEQLAAIDRKMEKISSYRGPARRPINFPAGNELDICCGPMRDDEIEEFLEKLRSEECVYDVRRVDVDGHWHIFASGNFENMSTREQQEKRLQKMAREFRDKSRSKRIRSVEKTTDKPLTR